MFLKDFALASCTAYIQCFWWYWITFLKDVDALMLWWIDWCWSWDDKVIRAKALRVVLYTRSFTGAGDDVCVCAGVTMGAFEPHAAPDKRGLIIPDCTGCCRKEDFSFNLSHWPWTQQGTFISKPSPSFSSSQVMLICFHAQALQPDCFTNRARNLIRHDG